jgi:tRNA(Ile2)-agmatinylcytidine synthase
MRCLVGIDDTDSSRGLCTTYLAYRIACDLRRALEVVPYPRLVRLNPNIPFKTRGNAAVCLVVETKDPRTAFRLLSSKLAQLSDVRGGANSALVFLEDGRSVPRFRELYRDALCRVVSPARVRKMLDSAKVAYTTLGNGMGLVGASASIGFDEAEDHTFELISYRRRESWGALRDIDAASVKDMDRLTFPRTFNSYDYQKRKVLICPHGPDPVFAGLRGDSPSSVIDAFGRLRIGEEIEGYMVYVTNQHTDAHLSLPLDWKTYSSGWTEGLVESVETGPGGHVYATLREGRISRRCAFYEPTGDLRRAAKMLVKGDRVRLSGGIRRPTSAHDKILNVEKMEMVVPVPVPGRAFPRGTYIASPRANRHLTKPLIRYGRGASSPLTEARSWLVGEAIPQRAPSRSPKSGLQNLLSPLKP